MAHQNRGDDRRPTRHYESEPVRSQHRWPAGFYTGEPDVAERTRRSGERPHGWGNLETNYDLPGGGLRRIDPQGRDSQQRDFRGKGPKGFRRSDARTREIICEHLTEHPHIDASEIEVEVSEGEVRLSGCVGDRRTKYAVEELVEHCAGAADIDNQLRVQRREEREQAQELASGRPGEEWFRN